MAKTTKRHYELFKQECLKWINIFGMSDWEVYFCHKKVAADQKKEGILAYCSLDNVSRYATFYLHKDWEDDIVTDKEIKKTAFHEVMELLLGQINCLASERFVTEKQIEEAVHSIIRTFENVVYPVLG